MGPAKRPAAPTPLPGARAPSPPVGDAPAATGESPLAGVDFSLDIGSRENVSLDYVSQFRVQFLVAQNQGLLRQTQFADTKAGTLLALVGLVATSLAARFDPNAVGADDVALFGLKALVLCLCLMVLMPRFPSGALRRSQARRELFSWVALSSPDVSPERYAAFARSAQASELVVSAAYNNAVIARILLRKFLFLRAAFLAAILDVILTVLWLLELTPTGAAMARALGLG
jgi:hypothetical protein